MIVHIALSSVCHYSVPTLSNAEYSIINWGPLATKILFTGTGITYYGTYNKADYEKSASHSFVMWNTVYMGQVSVPCDHSIFSFVTKSKG